MYELPDIYLNIYELPQLPKNRHDRYVDYLNHDGGLTFAEYLGIDEPVEEYFYKNNHERFIRFKNRNVTGEFCKTKKEAKISYKMALKRLREYRKKCTSNKEKND